ncbi:PilZ domain-containing protein [Mariprofundus sp. KV]|uniref:PilZ domain-containing protein n=1 Tax=Mariprofundus sp. KV TaxID=2608715 RepID=UPI00159F83B9|nr:PilZ domain-containing protein [Mariprofundus sp. KV]NWF36060.1 PilZ domain-containing protein [Mariprofundus sp. KV]
MGVEQRKEERSSAPELSKGELFHPGSGQYLHVESVRDLSFTGIGLKVEAPLDEGEEIQLGFKHFGRAGFQIYGRVVWCSPVTDEVSGDQSTVSFMMGISI